MLLEKVRSTVIPNLAFCLIDHTIDPYVGPWCPSGHDLRGPPRGVADSQDLLVRQLVQFMAQLSHLSFPAICSIALPPQPCEVANRLFWLFCPSAHSSTGASTSKDAPRSRSTGAHSPQCAHTSSLAQSESAPRPARCSRRVPPWELSARLCSRRRRPSSSAWSCCLLNSCGAARVLNALILSWLGTRSICTSSD